MIRLKSALRLCLVGLAVCSQPVFAQTKPEPKTTAPLSATDLERVSVGKSAPDFTLTDQDGKPVTLSNYRGKKAVVLVFYRGYW